MDAPPFVHLHCHSHYSLLDGASPIKKLVARAKELGMNGLALTDHGNLYGALEFYKACTDEGINPIIGYEAYIAPGSRFDKGGATSSKDASYHLTLLAQNATGFRNLIKMSSRAFLEGFYHKPRIDKELLAAHNEGIICLSGCVSGELSRTLLSGNTSDDAMRAGEEIVGWFHKTFGDRYFLEIQNNGVEIQQAAMELTVDLAGRMGLPLVATSDAHYVNREDAEAQDVLLCINTGKFRTDAGRMKMEGDQFYLRSPEDMFTAMPDHADALARSQRIADSVDIDLKLGERHFPTFTRPGANKPNITASQAYLRELVHRSGSRSATPRRPSAGRRQSAITRRAVEDEVHCPSRPRTGRDQQARLPGLLPDRVGLCPLRRGERHPVQRPVVRASGHWSATR